MSKAIPRFLYHLTSKSNYEAIMSSGGIRTTKDALLGEGVFMVELTNLFKRWRGSKDWIAPSLQDKLLGHIAKGESEIVILKIPTEGLNVDSLRIRSQNQLFRGTKPLSTTPKEVKTLPKLELSEFAKKCRLKKLDKPLLKSAGLNESAGLKEVSYEKEMTSIEKAKKSLEALLQTFPEHLKQGDTAKSRKLYQQRKEAIEYFYPEEISIDKLEKIGEINVNQLRKTIEYDPLKPMRTIFSSLLKGTPQEKGALLLNC